MRVSGKGGFRVSVQCVRCPVDGGVEDATRCLFYDEQQQVRGSVRVRVRVRG